jgi:predicted CopG family antitoxin
MNNLHLDELKETYDKNILKTIVVSQKNYNRLKDLGFGGDSFNKIVERLLDKLESED